MQFYKKQPPRIFIVGNNSEIEIKDVGEIYLDANEQVTFITPEGAEYDVTRKNWGFYATPSMNARLAAQGLKAGLVMNSIGRLFLMLVEKGKENEFIDYLSNDNQRLLSWLCTDADVKQIERCITLTGSDLSWEAGRNDEFHQKPGDVPLISRHCPMCNGTGLLVHFVYPAPPPGEFQYRFTEGIAYWRELHRCQQCGHFLEHHQMDQNAFYTDDYVSATYGDQDKVKAAFEKITALPEQKSDNNGRVHRVQEFANGYFSSDRFAADSPRLLDVGSGLCVFGYKMKNAGWDVSAIDMDKRLVEHARDVVGVNAMLADVTSVQGIGTFDLISFNKVLEHVEDPVSMLASVRRLLAEDGFIYIELPDGENAEIEGQDREEFLLGHIHVFSPASLALMVRKAGFNLISMERLREPSNKFTLRAFLRI